LSYDTNVTDSQDDVAGLVQKAKNLSESKKATEWIQKKWTGSQACPICRHDDWSVGPVLEIRQYHEGNLVLGGSAIVPIFPVTCTTCGYTCLFSAILAGLIEADAP
jgi:hypothetical protein